MKFTVKIDTRLMILTPNHWPSQHFGNDNKGIIVKADSAAIALDTVAHMTGVSQSVLVADVK